MKLILPLRIVQTIFAIATLGLASFVAHWYNTATFLFSPHPINLLIFTPVWSLISIAYLELTPRFAPRASHPYVAVIFEALNTIFYMAGFISLAVFLSRLLFCRGSECPAAQTVAVLGAAQFVLWGVTTVLTAMYIFKGGVRRNGTQPVPPPMRETV